MTSCLKKDTKLTKVRDTKAKGNADGNQWSFKKYDLPKN